MILPVPEGTVVTTQDGGVLADLVGPGASVTVARGGRGGLGNKALSSTVARHPASPSGERVSDVVLELKSLADVALIGFPSAGKSSLVSVISAARPRSPITRSRRSCPTRVVTAGDVRFTVADVPG